MLHMLKKTQCPKCKEMSYSQTAGCPCERAPVTLEEVATQAAEKVASYVTPDTHSVEVRFDEASAPLPGEVCALCQETKPSKNALRQRAYREGLKND